MRIQDNSAWMFGVSILTGLLMSVPFLHYQMGWLVIISLVPFFFFVEQLNKNKTISKRSKIAYIWLTGWVFLLGVTFWLVQTEPARWTGLMGWVSIGSLVLTYILFSGFLSLGFVFLGLGWVYLKINFTQKRIFLVLPALWVVCEFLRSWLFSAISLGPNTTLGPHWNFGDLGFAASVTPLVFISRFVGLYGLGFIVIVVNLCIFWLIQKRWKLPLLILSAIIITTLLGYVVYQKPSGSQVEVGALQLGKNEDLQIGSIPYHEALANIAPEKSLDVIVLPEYSEIFQETAREKDKNNLTTIAMSNDTPVITSVQSVSGSKNYNTVVVYKPNGEELYRHNKQFLVPIGEAMPYAYTYLFKLIGQGKVIDGTASAREVSKGDTPAEPFSVNNIKLGLQACSGAISPELYRDLVRQGATLLTNSASLSIFYSAPTYHQQAQQMARFMAVANARPFAQATDGSYSFIIDSNGNWIVKSGRINLELIRAKIQLNTHNTLYSVLGEWVILISIIIISGQIVALTRKQKHSALKK